MWTVRVTLPLAAADAPSAAVAVLAGIVALSITAIAWETLRRIITMTHEGSHAMAAWLVDSRVYSVVLSRDKNLTKRAATGRRSSEVLIKSAGYIGPSFFGLLGSLLLVRGQVEPVLWISVVLLGLLLLKVATWFGRIGVTLTGAVLFVMARYAPDALQTLFAATWIWFLLIGGFGNVIRLHHARQAAKAAKKPDKSSDVYALWKLILVPPPVGVALFWLGSLAALILGAGILLGLVEAPSGPPAPAAPTATPT